MIESIDSFVDYWKHARSPLFRHVIRDDDPTIGRLASHVLAGVPAASATLPGTPDKQIFTARPTPGIST